MTGAFLIACGIVVPLMALFAALLAGRRAHLVVLVAGPLSAAAAAALCLLVWHFGALSLEVGGWAAPLGIGLRADGLASAFVLSTALISLAAGLQARREFRDGGHETARAYAFWPLFFALWTGINAIALSGDLFNIYVGLELLTIGAVALVALGDREAALRYLHFALMGSLAFLLGVVLLYAAYGTLDIALLGARATPGPHAYVAGGLITVGLMAKAALFPFHGWLPPAHGQAPAPASALLSALVVKAAFLVIVRVWFDVLPGIATATMLQALGLLGAAAVLYGSLLAMRQQRLKLIVAYSTVAQIGYLFFMFPLAGGEAGDMPWAAGAWSGGIFHALSHAFAKAAMFLAAGLIIEAAGEDGLDRLKGLGEAMPMTVFAFGLAAISIMGLPPSGGFMAKYLLLTSALSSGSLVFAFAMLAGGLLAAIYLFRPLGRMMMAGGDGTGFAPVPRGRQAVPLLLALVAILIGVASSLPYEFIQIGRPGAALEGIE